MLVASSVNAVDDLQQLVSHQGYNAREFSEFVKKNEQLLDAMKHNLRRDCVPELTKLILRSDKDGANMTTDDKIGMIVSRGSMMGVSEKERHARIAKIANVAHKCAFRSMKTVKVLEKMSQNGCEEKCVIGEETV